MTNQDIKALCKAEYNREKWFEFLNQIFKTDLFAKEIEKYKKSELTDAIFQLGKVYTSDQREIGVFEVKLNENVKINRNRIRIRQLLRSEFGQYDAVLVAFYQHNKWRFSFISETKTRDSEGNTVKVETEPKRFTYVLGHGEKVKTAVERFSLLQDNGLKTTLDDIKEAFSVERISDEFFRTLPKHCSIYYRKTVCKGQRKMGGENNP